MPITPFSAIPNRQQSPENFAATADAFLGEFPRFVTEANDLVADVNTAKTICTSAASAATQKAADAMQHATAARDAASLAGAAAGAAAWVSGRYYAAGETAYSSRTSLVYRRVVAGSGTVDPSLDTTNWKEVLVPFTEDMANMNNAALLESLVQTQALHSAVNALRIGPWACQGEAKLTNRGVVSGCVVTKSTTVARKLDIATGLVFANGRTYNVLSMTSAADVPSNTGSGATTVYAYLVPHTDGTYRLSVASSVPENGILVYTLTIPAGNTSATDPYLNNVTMTDVRRIEADWPVMMSSPPYVEVALSRTMRSSAFALTLDPVSWTGPQTPPTLLATSRATNGFVVSLYSAHDSVVFRWRLSKLDD
jgi:hypothetical protein